MARRSPRAKKSPPVRTRWVDAALRESDRRAVAREMVAVLLDRPQPAVDAPAARSATLVGDGDEAPLSYRLLSERVYWNGREIAPPAPQEVREEPQRGPLPAALPGARNRKLAKAGTPLAQVRGGQLQPKRKAAVSNRARRRPGSGGRPPAPDRDPLRVIAELVEKHGPPVATEHFGQAKMHRWDFNPAGDALAFARISGREMKKGLTVGGQVHGCLTLAEENHLAVRHLYVSVHLSGDNRLHDRPDLLRCQQAVEDGWCKQVIWREGDRMFRRRSTAGTHTEFLMDHDVGLWLTDEGGLVDWENDGDNLLLEIGQVIGRAERTKTMRRTQKALQNQYICEGKGWPGSKPFGCRRDPHGYLEADPEQWPYVRYIFERYLELGRQGGGGVQALEAELAATGECDLSASVIHDILRRSIYCDGSWTVRYRGERVGMEALKGLGRPGCQAISPDVFQQVQDLLAIRGANHTRTPPGKFLLNTIPFIHNTCHQHRNDKQQKPMLRARAYKDRELRAHAYAHAPFVPACCKGLTFDLTAVEHAVIRRIWELAETTELAEEWFDGQRPRAMSRGVALAAGKAHQLAEEIANLEAGKTQQEKTFAAEVAAGKPADPKIYQAMIGTLDDAIAAKQAQLDMQREAEPPPQAPPPPDQDRLRARLHEILTLDTPEDPVAIARRAALFKCVVSQVVAYTDNDQLMLEIHGPLVPNDERIEAGKHGVLAKVAEALKHERKGEGPVAAAKEAAEKCEAEGEVAEVGSNSHTVREECSYRTVCEKPFRLARRPTQRISKSLRGQNRFCYGERARPAWAALVRVEGARDSRDPVSAWSLARFDRVMADVLERHPDALPLTAANYKLLTKAEPILSERDLVLFARRERMDPVDLRERTTRAFYAAHPDLEAEGWERITLQRGGQARWTTIAQAVSAFAELLVNDPDLVPFTAQKQDGLPGNIKRYPSRAMLARIPGASAPLIRRWATELAIRTAPTETAKLLRQRRRIPAGDPRHHRIIDRELRDRTAREVFEAPRTPRTMAQVGETPDPSGLPAPDASHPAANPASAFEQLQEHLADLRKAAAGPVSDPNGMPP